MEKEFWIRLQERLAKLVKLERIDVSKVRLIAGADVSYEKKRAVAVVQDLKSGEVLETAIAKVEEEFPYIPGLFAFREGPAIMKALLKLKSSFDLLLVDGHGYAHPRRAGLACLVGLAVEKPTIGVAKSLLIGRVKGKGRIVPIVDKGEIIGYRIKADKTFYASPGYGIDLKNTLDFFKLTDFEYPQVLRIADKLSKS